MLIKILKLKFSLFCVAASQELIKCNVKLVESKQLVSGQAHNEMLRLHVDSSELRFKITI